jgi:hypothetical protein
MVCENDGKQKDGADVHTRTRRVAGCGRVSAVDRAASAREGGVGALGVIHFTEGTYIYTGRAARGLRARVLRHVRAQCDCTGTSITCWRSVMPGLKG